MTRYAVDVRVDSFQEQSTVVEADTPLEAEFVVMDDPSTTVHGYAEGQHIEVADVRELYE
jgi:hypothetical protein